MAIKLVLEVQRLVQALPVALAYVSTKTDVAPVGVTRCSHEIACSI